jgi:hypothetical protein
MSDIIDDPKGLLNKSTTAVLPTEASGVHIEEVTATMPEVVPDAVAAAAAKEQEVKVEQAKTYNAKGQAFDPTQHAVDKDGKPILTPSGRFKKLSKPALALNTGAEQKQEQAQAQQADIQRMQCAKIAVGCFLQVTTGIFGDEWKPENVDGIDEGENLVICTNEYLRQFPDIDIPPGWLLAFALLNYCGRRIGKPKTQTKLEKIKNWFIAKWAGLVSWNAARKAK